VIVVGEIVVVVVVVVVVIVVTSGGGGGSGDGFTITWLAWSSCGWSEGDYLLKWLMVIHSSSSSYYYNFRSAGLKWEI